MSFLWNPLPAPVFTASGQFASGAAAYFFVAGTTTPLTVYQDAAFTIPHTSPVIADQIGIFPPVFIPYGSYRRRVVDANFELIPNGDADNIDNPAPPSSGGGIVVTQDQIFQTGFTIWQDVSGLLNGWVRRNGNTIGSAASAAVELKSDTTQNLFLYIYQNYTDAIAPVSGGRTGNAAADYAANKTIVVPSMQGRLMGGLDDMGGAAAGVLQATTTCTKNGTNVVVVVSAANLAVGMNCIIEGVGGRTITAISGLNITVSSVVAGAGAGISFRASMFADAQVAASKAGLITLTQTSDQMPVHLHGVTDPGHLHTFGDPNGLAFTLGAANGRAAASTPANTSSATTGLTINNTGGGNPMAMLPPMALGTYFMKL